MQAVGLISEYNPFHNGHLHHLRASLDIADAEVAVAVMSGHFLQRGEAALVDKWQRARMAVAAGVDVVVELPLPWACSSAADFAAGAVQALDLLGGVASFCFGSEAGALQPLQSCSAWLAAQGQTLGGKTRELLRQGLSYPQARTGFVKEQFSAEMAAICAEPNNILGIEYLKAVRLSGSSLRPLTIRRIGAGYHATHACDGIASASGIRQRIAAGEEFATLLPAAAAKLLQDDLSCGRHVSGQQLLRQLQGQIFRNERQLARYWLVDNGLEKRLLDAADRATQLDELISAIKSRHLTRTRVQRMLIALLLGWETEHIRALLASAPRYLHLLAVSRAGEHFLAATRKQRQVPLVTNFSRIYAQLKRHYGVASAAYQLAMLQLQLETTATRCYALLLHEPPPGFYSRDFFMPVQNGR